MRQHLNQLFDKIISKAVNANSFMPTSILGVDRDHLRLRTLVQLRWLAIIGQATMVCVIAFGFHFEMRFWEAISVIATSLWLNLMLTFIKRSTLRLQRWEAMLQLSFDVAQLAVLLGFTGGLDNPFCLLLMAPATVAAANLPTRNSSIVVLVSLIAACALAFYAAPLPWQNQGGFQLPQIYRYGVLAAIIIGIVFTAAYAWLAAIENSRMERALAATQTILEKEHRMSALGGLAAAAAHELGTPLGTIQVVAKEMMLGLKPDDPLYEDAALLVSQSQRCRDILKSLSAKPETHDQSHDEMTVAAYFAVITEPFLRYGKTIRLEAEVSGAEEGADAAELIYIQRRPEWVYALSAFIENACDFARSEVLIRILVNKVFVSLSIEDDGPGFAPEIMAKLGEPYVSSRVFGDDATKAEKKSYSGMGLGFFIAKTLLENTKANVTFGNREDGGAYIRALWRRDQIDILWTNETKTN